MSSSTKLELENAQRSLDEAKIIWDKYSRQRKKDGQFSKEKIEARNRYQTLKAEVARLTKAVHIESTVPVAQSTPLLPMKNSSGGSGGSSVNADASETNGECPVDRDNSLREGKHIQPSPHEGEDSGSTVVPSMGNTEAPKAAGAYTVIQGERMDLDKQDVADDDALGDDDPETAAMEPAKKVEVDGNVHDGDGKGKRKRSEVESADTADEEVDAGHNADKTLRLRSLTTAAADDAANNESDVSDTDIDSAGIRKNKDPMDVEEAPRDKVVDARIIVIPIPERLEDFCATYTPVDWKTYPVMKTSKSWSPALRQLKLKHYKASAELSYAQQQFTQMVGYSNYLYDAVDGKIGGGKFKAQATYLIIRKWIEPIINTASARMEEYSPIVEKLDTDIESLLEREKKKAHIPNLTKRLAAIDKRMLVAPERELLELRDEKKEIMGELEAVKEKAKAKKAASQSRKRAKTESATQAEGSLAAIAGDEKLYTISDVESDGEADARPVRRDTLYWNTDDAGRENMRDMAQAILNDILTARTKSAQLQVIADIQSKIRRAAREVQEFFPQSAWTSYELALKMHETTANNWQCRYHQRHGRSRDREGYDTRYIFLGVGFPKTLSSTGEGGVIVTPPEGHMHCGCAIEEVLYEFFFWKTLSKKSTNPELDGIFTMGDHDIPTPAVRAFWVRSIKWLSGLQLSDLYGPQPVNDGKHEWRLRLLNTSIANHKWKVAQLTSGASDGDDSEDDSDYVCSDREDDPFEGTTEMVQREVEGLIAERREAIQAVSRVEHRGGEGATVSSEAEESGSVYDPESEDE